MQYSDRSMSMLSFNHVLALSLSWHTKRKTGELLRILDRGSAINRVGELIGFTVVPALVDICVALVVFVVKFEPALGAVVGVVMGSYIWASVVLTRYRTRIRRLMNERDVVSVQCYSLSMERVLILCLLRTCVGSIRIVSSIMRLSSTSVGRSMRRRDIRRLSRSIRVWRRGLFVSVFASSHFQNRVSLPSCFHFQSFISMANANADHTCSITQPPEPRANAHHHLWSSGRFLDRRVAHHKRTE